MRAQGTTLSGGPDKPVTMLPFASLPLFLGFPYLVTRVSPALYHVIVLPAASSRDELLDFARTQTAANALQACLALGAWKGVWLESDGSARSIDQVPRGGQVITGKLQPCQDFKQTPEHEDRLANLGHFILERKRPGYLLGDTTKGGHLASDDELAGLAGSQGDGVPTGLVRCGVCGEHHGECLDPDPAFAGMVMRVWCRCDNDNRCARCGQLLHARKLNANFYREGQVWHVPGFCGLSHHCPLTGTEQAVRRGAM